MDKTKVKSILPKPSPSLPSQTPSPSLASTNKRKSLPGAASSDFTVNKKQRSKSSASIPTKKKLSAKKQDNWDDLHRNTSTNQPPNKPARANSVNSVPPSASIPHSNTSSNSPPHQHLSINPHINSDSNVHDIHALSPTDSHHEKSSKQTGHRPVTSCTFCRQHKIKCNASENYPNPCQRCDRMGLKCEIDPQFRPKKGSQIQSLKSDVDELKAKIEMLTKNESLLTQALNQHNLNFLQSQQQQQQQQPFPHQLPSQSFPHHNQQQQQLYNTTPVQRPAWGGSMSNYSTNGNNTPTHFQLDGSPSTFPGIPPNSTSSGPMVANNASPASHQGALNQATPTNKAPTGPLNDSVPNQSNPNLSYVLHQESSDNSPATINNDSRGAHNTAVGASTEISGNPHPHIKLEDNDDQFDYATISEFILGSVRLPIEKANELHDRFMEKFLPFLPILSSNSATELYNKSQLLFWSVILTAALSEPEPTLYMSLASLIKQLAIETCWIRTPRSTHVIQSLIILSIWPLPNEKVLDDCSYRFIGLAKNLSLQLGLHRGGEFIQEFSRTQVSLGPDAELWRTRSWLAVFFCEQFWSSVLGLPPSINTTDYLLENARIDNTLPKNFRCLISLSIFQCKLVNVMGISVTRSDGLLEPSNRAGSLNILDRELERLRFKLPIEEGSVIEVYYLYVKLMICCFAFLPGTPIEDQVKYVSSAYLSATRIITLTSQMISNNTIMLIELPIYVRQAMTYSVLLLFKLHLSRYLIDKYVDSARQSIVTVHRLLRNTLSSWKDLQNDISRTAKVLENLNIVLYTYPEIFEGADHDAQQFIGGGSIITRMRSHLTASLFYDLVWCVHEARRRTMIDKNGNGGTTASAKSPSSNKDSKQESEQGHMGRAAPLPFYNQITKDDFQTITTTTPNGTTITTLVPTDQAMTQARSNANANGLNKPLEINGIPLAMLEATGSIKDMNPINKKVKPNATGSTNHNATDGEVAINANSSIPNEAQAVGQRSNYNGETNKPSTQNPAATGHQNKDESMPSNVTLPQTTPYNNEFSSNANASGSMASVGQFEQLPPFSPQGGATVNQQGVYMGNGGVDSPANFNYGMSGPMLPSSNIPDGTVGASAGPDGVADQMDNFFQQQSNGWINNDNYQDDDFLGWFDINMIPEK